MKERGSTCRPLRSTSKCTCGPVEWPVDPMSATASPRFTVSPTRTSVRWFVRVAGDEAVAVTDLDELAET